MSLNPKTPWHKASYDQFLSDSLPQLLAERLPLAGYQVLENDSPAHTCTVVVELAGGAKAAYPAIPQPDQDGVVYLHGNPHVVIPLASSEELDQAQVDCVGEQLLAFIQEHLGQASNGLAWDEEILQAWLQALRNDGVVVTPRPVAGRDGRLIQHVGTARRHQHQVGEAHHLHRPRCSPHVAGVAGLHEDEARGTAWHGHRGLGGRFGQHRKSQGQEKERDRIRGEIYQFIAKLKYIGGYTPDASHGFHPTWYPLKTSSRSLSGGCR